MPVRACAVALARVDNADMRSDGGGGSHRQAGHGREQLRSHNCACGWRRDPCTPVNVAPKNAAGRRAVRQLVSSEAPFGADGAGVKENVPSYGESAFMRNPSALQVRDTRRFCAALLLVFHPALPFQLHRTTAADG